MTDLDIDYDVSPCHDPQTRACLSLWAAVFCNGIVGYLRGDATDWFWERRRFPGSFCWLCDLFDIEPDQARTLIERRADR